ncbi:hypothetical protein [Streptomyces sp. AC555_RSS877]|uniref:hypothetical protein n=1 Tax=Streptomyces sp. AC555_RSS877 TaxID=2823688 RepID=UPI001C27D871|nr:hypothetical protein [Streptomyces sp. AC555_RSS877]
MVPGRLPEAAGFALALADWPGSRRRLVRRLRGGTGSSARALGGGFRRRRDHFGAGA